MGNGITVEYFGPAKEFTDNISKDEIEFTEFEKYSNNKDNKNDDDINIVTLFKILNDKYSFKFIEFIIINCGIVLNYEYLELDRDLILNLFIKYKDNVDLIESEIFHQFFEIKLQNGDEIVIVPPVSSG
ncbi:hypothetical protein B5S28_g3782 [[Candida] boidinii]|uniref:Unnamed protein product n=1 Tax=Candida boidinii TaxID=5477 RepID=A0ACB5TI81_CANBO|nr:hypothetical protein B5S28_g3782 [[Candida] boidinii]OWB60369.1 hypothetical protein B5S29_g1243 [[Candida] boidinii]OWB75465.1 hypothetical protein B5S31_g5370 [[Candida] boidinii]OWB80076.1 hypothetical protein B5S32_g4325 [[Candida] boidinii]GME89102.1 unnamed protein product [[Candida] boidinii]